MASLKVYKVRVKESADFHHYGLKSRKCFIIYNLSIDGIIVGIKKERGGKMERKIKY